MKTITFRGFFQSFFQSLIKNELCCSTMIFIATVFSSMIKENLPPSSTDNVYLPGLYRKRTDIERFWMEEVELENQFGTIIPKDSTRNPISCPGNSHWSTN